MSKIDVEQLRLSVLHTEFETAQEIRNACIERGFSVANGFAVTYRAGVNAGRQAQKENLHRVYRDLAAARERISTLEQSYQRMVQLQELLAHPLPSHNLDEIIREIDERAEEIGVPLVEDTTGASETTEQSIPDVKTEEENNV